MSEKSYITLYAMRDHLGKEFAAGAAVTLDDDRAAPLLAQDLIVPTKAAKVERSPAPLPETEEVKAAAGAVFDAKKAVKEAEAKLAKAKANQKSACAVELEKAKATLAEAVQNLEALTAAKGAA